VDDEPKSEVRAVARRSLVSDVRVCQIGVLIVFRLFTFFNPLSQIAQLGLPSTVHRHCDRVVG
jgi:hypothetical protein